MINRLRRYYNAVDQLFDRGAISRELRFSRDEPETDHPQSALRVFQRMLPLAHELDRQARLKRIVSQQGLLVDGTSAHWEFFFDLPRRRAQLIIEWALAWVEPADDYGPARIDVRVSPFPPPDSSFRRMVNEGKLLHRQLIGLWQQEVRRRPNLPHRFRDTDAALAEFIKQGLDVSQDEFSLSTGQSPQGRLCWMAQTRRKSYYAAFE